MSILQRFSMKDHVAIITGGGKGIGRGIALAFAEAGANVVLAARTEADVIAVAREAETFGVRALGVACDVNDEKELARLVQLTHDTFGKITTLVNNAGGAGPNDPLKLTPSEFDGIFHFNVTTAYALTALAVPHMRAAGGGSIINISSAAGRLIQKNFSAYGTAKAALNHLTKLLAQDFAPSVRVNAIAPGSILTDSLKGFLNQDLLDKMASKTPMQSNGEVYDIAAAALFLASPAGRWVTGKILEVDGGTEQPSMPF